MKSILLMSLFLIMSSCNKENKNSLNTSFDVRKTECENFVFPVEKNSITKIIVKRDNINLRELESRMEIDSVCNKLENSCSEFIKFGSKTQLHFYAKDSLSFIIFSGDTYFKYDGHVFRYK